MGYLSKLKKAEEKRLQDEKESKLREKLEAEALVGEWLHWTCVTCGKPNRRPAHIPPSFDLAFGITGLYYKRPYVEMKPSLTVPVCHFCYTPSDYIPALCSVHLFKHAPDRYIAFQEYPQNVTSQAGLSQSWLKQKYNTFSGWFFGLQDSPDSLVMMNDWRLRRYLPTRFAPIPRGGRKFKALQHQKQKDEAQSRPSTHESLAQSDAEEGNRITYDVEGGIQMTARDMLQTVSAPDITKAPGDSTIERDLLSRGSEFNKQRTSEIPQLDLLHMSSPQNAGVSAVGGNPYEVKPFDESAYEGGDRQVSSQGSEIDLVSRMNMLREEHSELNLGVVDEGALMTTRDPEMGAKYGHHIPVSLIEENNAAVSAEEAGLVR
jgi:predicted  nucleic acid-binding Zn-ribbon protein